MSSIWDSLYSVWSELHWGFWIWVSIFITLIGGLMIKFFSMSDDIY